jgi:hypothetical protein
METLHPEGDSPFAAVKEDHASDRPGTAEDISYVECPVDGCGEVLLLQELDYHLELHTEESGDHLQEEPAPVPEPDPKPDASLFGPSRAHREAERQRRSDHEPEGNDRQAKAISAWKRLLRMPGSSSAHRGSQDEKHTTRGKRLGVSAPGWKPR